MDDHEGFKEFFGLMENGINEHKPVYGDSWKMADRGYLESRLRHKMAEYELTKSPNKLISIANLAMLLYVKLVHHKGGQDVTPK